MAEAALRNTGELLSGAVFSASPRLGRGRDLDRDRRRVDEDPDMGITEGLTGVTGLEPLPERKRLFISSTASSVCLRGVLVALKLVGLSTKSEESLARLLLRRVLEREATSVSFRDVRGWRLGLGLSLSLRSE